MLRVPSALRARILAWLHDRPDDSVLQFVFRSLLALTLLIVGLDLYQRSQVVDGMPQASREPAREVLAPAAPPPADGSPGGPLRRSDPALQQAMTFDLVEGGRLMAIGTIVPGTAMRFAEEVGKRGGYVRAVVLHSPGGSVSDALAMGRLIRAKGFATAVEGGRYCASSCPLVFAGGVERRAAAEAAIGVHQVFALAEGKAAAGDMAGAQRVSAEIQRYLVDMGVDLQVWMHAMATPKDSLYYFKPEELVTLRLATAVGDTHAAATPAAPKS